MIYGVKGSREIKQTEAGDLLTTNGMWVGCVTIIVIL